MIMMIIGDPPPSNPTVNFPSSEINHPHAEDPTAHVHSPSHYDTALERFLPSNKSDDVVREESENPEHDLDLPVDAFSCDDFRMFEFKVKKCARARSHDWTECPFAHPGEKARRRDPRRYHYSGDACPDYRRGACRNGDACEYAHGVFECWLHPSRYRTLPCKDGTKCRRRVCFFAHTPEQLRFLNSPDGSPRKQDPDPDPDPLPSFGSSPRSTLFVSAPSSPTTVSPPISPGASLILSQLTEAMYGLQLSKMKMGLGHGLINSPPVWRLGFCSSGCPAKIRPGLTSLPSTPMQPVSRAGPSPFDPWDTCCQEEPAMERVESGKALREKIYAKIGKENSLDRTG